jgi:RNA polymerase sigma-70 factor, ECF subfamily
MELNLRGGVFITGMENEKELLQASQQGDRQAFQELVKSCAGKLYNMIYRLCGNKHSAEDIAQEAFVRAYVKINSFRGDCSFSSWVYSIAINIWKNSIRSDIRRKGFLHDSLDETRENEEGETKTQYADPGEGADTTAEKNCDREKISKALLELDEKDRVIIILRDLQEKSYEEISKIVKVPCGTVKSRLSRAREALRLKLIKLKDGEADE